MKKKLILLMLGVILTFSTVQKTYAAPGYYDDIPAEFWISCYEDGEVTLEELKAGAEYLSETAPDKALQIENYIAQHSGDSGAKAEQPVQTQQPVQEKSESTTTTTAEDTKNATTEIVIEVETSAHEHDFTETVTKEPTCTALGEKTFTCECGETYTEPIAMIEHTPGEWEEEVAATCTTEGKDVQKCTVCGNVIADRTTILTHLAGDWEVKEKPTMISKGTEVKKCVDCGKELETRETPVLMYPWYIIGGVVVLGGALTTGFAVKRKKRSAHDNPEQRK